MIGIIGTAVPVPPSTYCQGMWSKLKRLVRRGWLVEVEPGLFAAASGVADGLEGGSRQQQR